MRMPRFFHRSALPFLGVLFVATALVAGCSSANVGSVSGKVTAGGQPVSSGSVVFEDSAAGVSVNAPINSDGTFQVRTHDRDGLPPGTYRVAIRPATFGDGEVPLLANPADQPPAEASVIPEKYHDIATSELEVTIQAGENPPLAFEL